MFHPRIQLAIPAMELAARLEVRKVVPVLRDERSLLELWVGRPPRGKVDHIAQSGRLFALHPGVEIRDRKLLPPRIPHSHSRRNIPIRHTRAIPRIHLANIDRRLSGRGSVHRVRPRRPHPWRTPRMMCLVLA